MSYFPMMVEMNDKRILIVGAGNEAGKKIELMTGFGASVTVIAPDASLKASSLCTADGDHAVGASVNYISRPFEDSDIKNGDYDIVIAATDDHELNSRISALAKSEKLPVNIVDEEELCGFIFPAVIKRNEVVLAVSSGGKSPYLTQHIKKLIEDILPDNIGEINDIMGEYRRQAKEKFSDKEKRRGFLRSKLNELLAR